MSDNSRAYQKQITGREGQSYVKNNVKFDGYAKSRLQDAKANYTNFVNKKTGEFYKWFRGGKGLIDQANRQLNAANGTPIDWYFSNETSMNAVQTLFNKADIDWINLIYQPMV